MLGATVRRLDHRERIERRHLALGAVVLVGVAVRAYGLGTESFWSDELATLRFVSEWSYVELATGLPAVDPHPPLYYVLAKAWTSVAGTSEAGLRSLSTAADAASIGLTYAVAARLYDRRIGLVAALLFALSPFYVWYGREARMYALVALFALASFYCLLAMVEGDDEVYSGDLAYLVSTAALCYTHALGVLVVAAQSVALAGPMLDRARAGNVRIERWIRLQIYLGVALLPYYFVLFMRTFVTRQLMGYVSWIPEPGPATVWAVLGAYVGRAIPLATPGRRTPLWALGAGELRIVGEVVTLLALLVVLYALAGPLRDDRDAPDAGPDVRDTADVRPDDAPDDVADAGPLAPELVLGAWAFVPVAGMYLLSTAVTPVLIERFTAGAGAAVVILLARGLVELGGTDSGRSNPDRPARPDRRTLAVVGVAVLVLAVPLAGVHDAPNKQQWREAVDVVEADAAAGDLVLVSPWWAASNVETYGERDDLRVAGVPADGGDGAVRDAAGTEGVVWLVASFAETTDYDPLLAAFRRAGFEVDRHESLFDVEVYRLVRG